MRDWPTEVDRRKALIVNHDLGLTLVWRVDLKQSIAKDLAKTDLPRTRRRARQVKRPGIQINRRPHDAIITSDWAISSPGLASPMQESGARAVYLNDA